jgi:hypothetical protein
MSTPALELLQPPIQWVLGILSEGLKWLGHEADHTLSSCSAEVKNKRTISTPTHAVAVCTFHNMEFFNGIT